MHYVFVYGSLKTGQPNHNLLRGYSEILDVILPQEAGLALFNLGSFPGLSPTDALPVDPTEIHGQLVGYYDAVTFANIVAGLDILEGHPHLYFRGKLRLAFDGQHHDVVTYLFPINPERAQACLIKSGDWHGQPAPINSTEALK